MLSPYHARAGLLAGLVFALGLGTPVHAQSLWVGGPPNIDRPVATGASSPADYAVVIGVEDYVHLRDVGYAQRDARAVRDALVHTRGIPEERVQLLTDVDRAEILRALTRAGMRTAQGGTVWIYFAGHGAFSPARDERLLLGREVEKDVVMWQTQGVSLTEVQWLASSGGGRVVVVLEASFAGVGAGAETLLEDQAEGKPSAEAPADNVVIWSGAGPAGICAPLDEALHGAFTYFLIGAMRGWADGVGQEQADGRVTLGEAEAFVRRALGAIPGSSQVPTLELGAGLDRAAVDGWTLSASAGEPGPDLARLPELLAAAGGAAGATPTGTLPLPAGRYSAGEALAAHDYEMIRCCPHELGPVPEEPKVGPYTADYWTKPQEDPPTFLLGVTEVTQRLYAAVMGQNPSFFQGEDHPVERVSWFDAVRFCNRLSVVEGLEPAYRVQDDTVSWDVHASGYRLPTEAEWEAAARAGQATGFSGSDAVGDVAWYLVNAGSETHPVGTKEHNGIGLFDMSGNVWEWVWDEFGGEVEAPEDLDPIVAATIYGREIVPERREDEDELEESETARVLRGGSWLSVARHVHVGRRSGDNPYNRGINLGFRIARSLGAGERGGCSEPAADERAGESVGEHRDEAELDDDR